MNAYRNLKELIMPVSTNLIDLVRQLVGDSEKAFSKRTGKAQDSFLWEHTLHVASIAHQICLKENRDPLVPVIAALFHDTGKFYDGGYHENDTPEEEISASLARNILVGEGLDEAQIREIVVGLASLYHEGVSDNRVADIVHDADFLAKTGHLGVANFFIKGTLRGQNMQHSLIQSLSQELTYASVLPENMRTGAGRRMAGAKRRSLMHFFRSLLKELCDHGIGCFNIEEKPWPCPRDSGKTLRLLMALPGECPECSGNFITEYESEKGTKCTRIAADVRCTQCSNTYRISFCLPEICS